MPGRLAQWTVDADQAVQLAPKLARAYLVRADTLKAMKEYERAAQDHGHVIWLAPNDAGPYLGHLLLVSTALRSNTGGL